MVVLELLVVILLALALDRFVPPPLRVDPLDWCRRWAQTVEQKLGSGNRGHGIGAVVLVVLPPVLLVLLLRFVLSELAPVLRFVFDVVVLSWCIDLYRLVDRAQAVFDALKAEDLSVANEHLRLLTGADAAELNESGLARATIAALIAKGSSAVIAPIFWFILLGPAFAVLQRLAALLGEQWCQPNEGGGEYGRAAGRLDQVMAWVPVRITALSYAVMGNFEDALRCWRYHMRAPTDDATAPLLAAGLGALQLLACEDLPQTGGQGAGMAVTAAVPQADHVQRTVALLWRVLLFWLGLALLVLIGGALG